MSKSIARFITRPETQGSDKPNLGIISFTINNDVLKANRVYEIREVLGELTIVDIGECGIAYTRKESSRGLTDLCWPNCISYILDVGRKLIFLTKKSLKT